LRFNEVQCIDSVDEICEGLRNASRLEILWVMHITPLSDNDLHWVHALNQDYVTETSALTLDQLRRLVATAIYARGIAEDQTAFLIAVDQFSAYDSANFLWFRTQCDQFVYIDRVIVSRFAHGRGCARALYQDLHNFAVQAGYRRLVCEVNIIPPNPASDAFHTGMGFQEVGRGSFQKGRKIVRYLELKI
jgi:uncharacterized protein